MTSSQFKDGTCVPCIGKQILHDRITREVGEGGRVDSGPTARGTRSVKQKQDPVIYLRLVFGCIYDLIAALLFGVATNVKCQDFHV